MTKNTRIDNETILTKEQLSKEFQSRYGFPPKELFYGKPNGTLLYAGPTPEKIPDIEPEPASPTPRLQPNQLSFLKDEPHGNHYQSS